MEKTNVMRVLDKLDVEYVPHEVAGMPTDGQKVAELLGVDGTVTAAPDGMPVFLPDAVRR